MLTVKAASERLGVSQALIYALIAARKIRHERHGMRRGAIRIPLDALAEYQQRCTVPTEGEQPSAAPRRTVRPSLEL